MANVCPDVVDRADHDTDVDTEEESGECMNVVASGDSVGLAGPIEPRWGTGSDPGPFIW